MRHTLQCIAAAVVAACTLAAQASAADAPANAQASTWQHHESKFTYMGFTASYTCDGIEGKVTQVLKYFGASKPEVRASGCPRGPNSLSRIINVEVKFDTLSAAAAETPAAQVVQAQWLPISLNGQRPFFMGLGDCELIDSMKPTLLATFSLRNVSYEASCTPHQVTFADFHVKGEVLKVPEGLKSGAEHSS